MMRQVFFIVCVNHGLLNVHVPFYKLTLKSLCAGCSHVDVVKGIACCSYASLEVNRSDDS
jgi:hypothetical protein